MDCKGIFHPHIDKAALHYLGILLCQTWLNETGAWFWKRITVFELLPKFRSKELKNYLTVTAIVFSRKHRKLKLSLFILWTLRDKSIISRIGSFSFLLQYLYWVKSRRSTSTELNVWEGSKTSQRPFFLETEWFEFKVQPRIAAAAKEIPIM
jgi:hypothetical protein